MYIETIPAETPIGQLNTTAAAPTRGLFTFWLPCVVIGLAMFAAEHSFEYASPLHTGDATFTDLVEEAGNSAPTRQVGFLVLGSYGALLLLKRESAPLALSRGVVFGMIALGALVMVSAFWADDLQLSMKRSVLLLLILVGALGFAKHWSPLQLCQFTVAITMTFLAIGFAAELASGAFQPGSGRRFCGTLDANMQAVNCAALCLASLALFIGSAFHSSVGFDKKWIIPLLLGLFFLFLTGSRTGTASLLAAGVAFIFFGASRTIRIWILGGLAMLVAIFTVVLLDNDANGGANLLGLIQMGRDQDANDMASLTGRIPIWRSVLYDVGERPLLGHGYGSFWSPTRVLEYSLNHDWEFMHAHSAYLESALNIGIVGVLLGLAVIMRSVWSAMKQFDATQNIGFLFAAVALTMGLIHGCLDSNFVVPGFALMLAMLCISIVAMHGGAISDDDESQSSLTTMAPPW